MRKFIVELKQVRNTNICNNITVGCESWQCHITNYGLLVDRKLNKPIWENAPAKPLTL